MRMRGVGLDDFCFLCSTFVCSTERVELYFIVLIVHTGHIYVQLGFVQAVHVVSLNWYGTSSLRTITIYIKKKQEMLNFLCQKKVYRSVHFIKSVPIGTFFRT